MLADVCQANDIGNPSAVAARLATDEKDTLDRIEGGNPGTRYTIVNEAGLYEAMRPSQKPFAKRLRENITSKSDCGSLSRNSWTSCRAPWLVTTSAARCRRIP